MYFLLLALLNLNSLLYLRNFFLIFILDGLLFDDEPVWEPIEWSMVQTWLLFLFLFTWASEVLFSSRYGSFTNRDKKVWIGLHKTYWLFQFWFITNIFIVFIFVTVPFYFEITYSVAYIVLWWNWFNSIFFFKITFIFSIILILLNIIKFQLRFMNILFIYILFLIILILISYLLYFSFFITFFSFFTDVNTFTNNGWISSNQLIHGPLKWGFGSENRDHFAYHKTTTTFWFKNDPLIAASLLFLNFFYFFFLFFLFFKTLIVVRVIYTTNNISYNLLTMYYSAVKQFYYLLLFLFTLILLCFVYQLIRYPFELYWFNKIFFLLFSFLVVFYDFIFYFCV